MADKKIMTVKFLSRTFLIGIPAALVLIQIFWRPFERPVELPKVIQTLIQPLDIVFRSFDFNQKNALAKWEEKVFKGHVAYWIDFENPLEGRLHAESKGASSAIFHRIKYKVTDYPMLTWKWRAAKFPDKSHSSVDRPKTRDDYAARIYVVFLSLFFTNFHCVEYVWDERLPEETVLESPYSPQIKQLVIQSGAVRPGVWVSEKRNVLEDYERLFGRKPKMKAAAIAVMTDADGTQSGAEGFFDDIQIGRDK